MYIKTIKRDRERKHSKTQYSFFFFLNYQRDTRSRGGVAGIQGARVHVVCITVRTGISQKNR